MVDEKKSKRRKTKADTERINVADQLTIIRIEVNRKAREVLDNAQNN